MREDDPKYRIEYLRSHGVAESVIALRLMKEGWSRDTVEAVLGLHVVPPPAPELAHTFFAPETAPGEPAQGTYTRQRIETKGRLRGHFSSVAILVVVVALSSLGVSAYAISKPHTEYTIAINESQATAPALSFGMLPQLADPNVYASTTEQLIFDRASFIVADLSAMRLTLYQNGTTTLEVPILAKGRVGSWWETPTGIYKIESKEPNHFSGFAGVNMPWSLDFDGNFFIHGWPTYPDGSPVAESYSGGCIRLATTDAAKVYALAEVGEPVVVYDTKPQGDPFSYELKATSISAQEYLVADVEDGTVLASQNASTSARIASITKLVTALTATQYINLDKNITVPQSAIIYTSKPRLFAGESVRAYDLLFLLLEESSNEAAETLASSIGRSYFVQKMNDTARSIGLAQTSFVDPSGVGDNESTAEDLFTLLRYINDNRRFVFGITADTITDSAYGQPAFSDIENFNQIPGAPATLEGGKVGETNAAKETYAGIFSVEIGNEPRNIAVIVLGSDDSVGDVRKLLTLVHNAYQPSEN